MEKLFLSSRILLEVNNESVLISGGILAGSDGKIKNIFYDLKDVQNFKKRKDVTVVDYGDLVIMPGLIDSHVHINEPGRTQWEGFETATKAAAAGGFTCIVDMPLNSIPPTTTLENLKIKLKAAKSKIHVDVGFWGGVIPNNFSELRAMVDHGVVGFKCFLCPSGVPEFPNVTEGDLVKALSQLEGTGSVLAFHAELCYSHSIDTTDTETADDPKKYETYLKSRPEIMELDAIKLISKLATKFNVRLHIVHLSSSAGIPIIRDARRNGCDITVETCHHYLSIASEDIPDARTEFKCAPPIRNRENREKLWQGIIDQDIHMVVSDHSPSTPDIKLLCGTNRGDFMNAWGGISSLQFGLSLFWTHCQQYNFTIHDVPRLLCNAQAELCKLDKFKGKIRIGYDADFCVWSPEEKQCIKRDMIEFQHKDTPYMDKTLTGVVHATIVRGHIVFELNKAFDTPRGKIILTQC